MRKLDLTHKQFGDLFVLFEDEPYISPKGYRKLQWRCKCVCGKEITVMSSHLTTGHTISCGCRRRRGLSIRQPENIIGQKFSMLTVIERLPNKLIGGIRRANWLCQCDCGNFTQVLGISLRTGYIKSCGCLNHSHGERLMNNYLSNLGVNYIPQYVSTDLVGVNNGFLKFDYAILDDFNHLVGLIELNGEQHYKSVKYFGGDDAFKVRKTHDQYKILWAKNNNVPLFIINTSKCISEQSFLEIYDKYLMNFLKQIKI